MSAALPFEGTAASRPITPPLDACSDALATRIAMHIESLVPRGRARCLDFLHGEPALAEAIRARTERAEWHCAEAPETGPLPFADGEFDVALLCDVLHAERDDTARARLLREVGRVARFVLVKDRFGDAAYATGAPQPAGVRGLPRNGLLVASRSFTRDAFVRLAAGERLRITALDSELDADATLPTARSSLERDRQFMAVLHSG
jgi:hypothetical protein